MGESGSNSLGNSGNGIMLGVVSSVDSENVTARVVIPALNNIVSGSLKVAQSNPPIWLPNVGQLVACVFISNGGGDGFILGGF